MKRRRAIGAMLAMGVAPAFAHARAVAQACALPPSVPPTRPTYDLDHPPWLPPGKRPATRRVWAASVAEYLATVGAAVGLDPGRQRITTIVDERWISAKAERGAVNTVRLEHPLLEIAVYVHRGRTRVGLFYQPGPRSPLWATRDPDSVQYFAVFRDATAPSGRGLIDRLTWLAGLQEHPLGRQLTDQCRA